ncbi:MDR family MFS transporter [Quisquiliibacterium transsilvanicum]
MSSDPEALQAGARPASAGAAPGAALPTSGPPSNALRVVLGLLLAMLLAALDQTLVSIALVSIGRDLDGLALAPWVVSGFLVASTVATPIYGKLSDVYGRRRLLSIAILLTMTASVLCAFAQSMPQLIALRVLQGLGSGGLMVLVQSVVADVAPGRERGRFQGYLSGVFAFAAVAGPILGGYLTHYLSWRAVFWLNLPLGLAALLAARRVLPGRGEERRAHRIDYPGAILLAAGLSSMMIGLTRMGRGHGLTEPTTLLLFGAAALLLALTALQERRAAEPLIPPALLRKPTVVLCCAILGMQFFVLIGCTVMMPMAMQALSGAGPDAVALRMLPLTLGIPCGAFTGGRWLYATASIRPPVVASGLLAAAGVSFFAVDPAAAGAVQFGGMLLLGFGLGLSMAPALVAAQSAVAPREVGVATATVALFRTLGGAMGIAVLSSIVFAVAGASDQPGAGLSELLAQSASGDRAPDGLVRGFRLAFGAAALLSLVAALLATRLPAGVAGRAHA